LTAKFFCIFVKLTKIQFFILIRYRDPNSDPLKFKTILQFIRSLSW